MRIISKFKDYYDSAMGMGVDNTLIYKRKTESLDLKKDFPNMAHKTFKVTINKHSHHGHVGVIFFCGKSYPFICYQIVDYNKTPDHYYKTFFSIDEFLTHIKKENKEMYENNTTTSKWRWNKTIRECFNILKETNPTEMHFEHKTPIILVEPTYEKKMEFTVNPKLKELGFFKVFDSYSAFQEIDMYISGVLGDIENKMVKISDKEKALKQGYHKYSFKTRPKDK